jgi:glycogen synthase
MQIFLRLLNLLFRQFNRLFRWLGKATDPLQPQPPDQHSVTPPISDEISDPIGDTTDNTTDEVVDKTISSPSQPRSLRVLHLTTEFPPVIYGGMGTAVGGLVAASAKAGLTVGVLLVGETGYAGYGQSIAAEQIDPVPEAMLHPTDITFFEASWWNVIETAIQIVQQWQPDVVHLHPFWLWFVARAIQERTGTPVVYTVHSLDRAEYEIGQGPPQCLTQWETQATAIAAADRIIALTESERILLIDYCPVTQGRVHVVGNGIDDDPEALAVMHRQSGNDSPLVLYTGRFVDRKGIRELIAAIPQVLEQAPNTHFILAGGHRHCSSAEMQQWWLPSELYPYREKIHFTGWLTPEEMAQWYRTADILVVPSWYEPFGMVILEGMLYGLAIAAAAVGGPAEILEHERTGLLFPPKDVEAIAQTILQLVENSQLRQQLGTRAARDVRQKWLWSHIVEKMQDVYTEAINTALLGVV